MATQKPSKSDINNVIMDYLISEGYPAAAEKFAEETNVSARNIEAIKERVKVRNAIYAGHLTEAIDLLNELNPVLQLIEIIREIVQNGNANAAEFRPALEFATQQLAPHAPQDPKHLDALEKTMALLVFKPDRMMPEMRELLDPSLREKVAAEVNKALLISEGKAPAARIRDLVRTRAWAEVQAREAGVALPEDISIGLDGETSTEGEAMVS